MTERAALEVDTLTIRIPIRLQRRGGRKLIMTPEGVAAPARKPSRDETLVKALVRAHRWRRRIESGQAKSITDGGGRRGACRRLLPPRPSPPPAGGEPWRGPQAAQRDPGRAGIKGKGPMGGGGGEGGGGFERGGKKGD